MPEIGHEYHFTDADRQRVERVLNDLVEEFNDSHDIVNMFQPYAEIVRMMLTDGRITLNIEDAARNDKTEPKRPRNYGWNAEASGLGPDDEIPTAELTTDREETTYHTDGKIGDTLYREGPSYGF